MIAADGLGSPLRRAAGLELAANGRRRFGLRRHYAVEPWADLVEVHWSAGAEAYVTPVGARSVNVAFLWEAGAFEEKASFDSLLARFPALGERVRSAAVESEARGAGPLSRRVKARADAQPDLALHVVDLFADRHIDAQPAVGLAQSRPAGRVELHPAAVELLHRHRKPADGEHRQRHFVLLLSLTHQKRPGEHFHKPE